MPARTRKYSPVIFVFVALLLPSCAPDNPAKRVIAAAVERHGGKHYEQAVVTFDFRGRHYRSERRGGLFRYERSWQDSLGLTRDVLSNDSLYREINGEKVTISPEWLAKYKSSVNSVIYFAMLPFPLLDSAVRPRHLGTTVLAGEPYHKIEVTFAREGGGKDFDDRFVYWIHEENETMDYLAYHFHVDDGGVRFRKATNPRVVGGIRFSDYLNYTSAEIDSNSIQNFDEVMEAGNLKLLSEINLINVSVNGESETR